MGKYTGYALDGQVLINPSITGGTMTNVTGEFEHVMFDGLTSIFGGFTTYVTSVTVANGQTVGDEASITMPANFTPAFLAYRVTTAATNAVSLVDVGRAGDADGFVDGIVSGASLDTTGFKGLVACNGTFGLGDITGGVTSQDTPDETRITVSGDPGATGVTIQLTFFGLRVSASDFSA